MQPVVIAAILAASAAVVSPIILELLKRYLDRDNPWVNASPERRKILHGTWTGEERAKTTATGDRMKVYYFKMTIDAAKKKLKGTIRVTLSAENRAWDLTFRGDFLSESYLRLDYTNPNRNIIQFGSLLLRLTSDGEELEGRLLGYGRDAERLVYGDVLMRKDADDQPNEFRPFSDKVAARE